MSFSKAEKESRKTNFINKILRGDKPTQAASFLKRNPTLKKKALELQTLCDISVCLVSFGPDGRVEIWPENQPQLRSEIASYKLLEQKLKRETNLFKFLKDKKAKLVKKKRNVIQRKVDGLIESLSKHADEVYGQELTDFVNFLQGKLKGFQDKKAFLEMAATPVRTSNPNFNPLLTNFDVDQKYPIDSTSASLQWNSNYHMGSSSGYPVTRIFNYDDVKVTENWGWSMQVSSNPMDEILKHIVKNENGLQNHPENLCVGNNFLYGSSSGGGSIPEAKYCDNSAVTVDQFNNNNNGVIGSTNSSYYGFAEASYRGDGNGQENVVDCWWNGKLV